MAQPWEQVLYSTPEEARLKRRLKFHFLNPWEKYEATGRLPWKLLLQILKVFLGTYLAVLRIRSGSAAFLTPGSGMGKKIKIWIRDEHSGSYF